MKNNYYVAKAVALGLTGILLCACGQNNAEVTGTEQTETANEEATVAGSDLLDAAALATVEEAVEPAEEASVDQSIETLSSSGDEVATLPKYVYTGSEPYLDVISNYLVDEIAPFYLEAEISIPCFGVVGVDDSNKEDVCVYGDFQIYNYNLEGETLVMVSGGSHPGCFHINSSNGSITAFDQVEDGSNYTESAKKIFGDLYEDFGKVSADSEKREERRAQTISEYVKTNNLSITAYQDFGWDPVTLP